MRISKSEIETKLFFTAYGLVLIFSFIGSETLFGSLFKNLSNISFIIIFALFLTNVNKFSRKELIHIFSFMILFCFIGLKSHEFNLLKLTIFTLGFKNVNFQLCIKYDIWFRICLIIFIYLLYTKGILPDVISTRDGLGSRHSYGFSNPNALALAVTILCMEFIYVYKQRKILLKLFLIAIIMFFITSITDSRTCFYAIIVYILLILINKYIPKLTHNLFFIKGIQLTPFILGIMVTYMIHSYLSNPFSAESLLYDKILSGRLSIAATYVSQFQPALFGNDLTSSVFIDRSLDNAYVSIFLSLGIIATIIILFAYWILIKKLYKRNEMVLIFIFFCFSIMGIGEKLLFAVDYNLLIILFGTLFYKGKVINHETN